MSYVCLYFKNFQKKQNLRKEKKRKKKLTQVAEKIYRLQDARVKEIIRFGLTNLIY